MRKNGFSLIELLVVISIIATLMAVVVPNYMGARERARDSQKIQELGAIKNALRMYYNDNQSYPPSDPAGEQDLSSVLSSYMPQINTEVGYTYYSESNGDSFRLCTWLEAGVGDDDFNSQVRCGSATQQHCNLGIGETIDKLYEVCAK